MVTSCIDDVVNILFFKNSTTKWEQYFTKLWCKPSYLVPRPTFLQNMYVYSIWNTPREQSMLLLHCFVKGNSQCNLGKNDSESGSSRLCRWYYFPVVNYDLVWHKFLTHPNFGLQSLLKSSLSLNCVCLSFAFTLDLLRRVEKFNSIEKCNLATYLVGIFLQECRAGLKCVFNVVSYECQKASDILTSDFVSEVHLISGRFWP